jgi:hypothetical protein
LSFFFCLFLKLQTVKDEELSSEDIPMAEQPSKNIPMTAQPSKSVHVVEEQELPPAR